MSFILQRSYYLFLVFLVCLTTPVNHPCAAPNPDVKAVTALVLQARGLAAKGKLNQAIKLSKQALAKTNKPGKTLQAYRSIVLFDLAKYLTQKNHYTAAKKNLLQALPIVRKLYGKNSKELAALNEQLGSLQNLLGNYREAFNNYKAAFAAFSALGNKPKAAQLAKKTALVLLALDDPKQAETFFTNAITIYQQDPKTKPAQLISVLLGLIQVYIDQGLLDKTKPLIDQAVELVARPGGEGLANQVTYTKALVLLRDSQLRKGEAILDKLLPKLKSAGQLNSLLAAHTLYQKGYVYTMRGLFVEAEPVFLQALDIYNKVYGSNHPMVAKIFHHLAMVHQVLGNLDQSEAYYKQAVTIMTKAFGKQSAQVITTDIERTLLDLAKNNVGRAKKRSRSAIRALKKMAKPNNRLLGLAHVGLGLSQKRRNSKKSALRSFNQAIKFLTKARNDMAPELYLALIEIGEINTELKHYKKAETALVKVIKILRRDQAVVPSKLARALKTLATLRLKQGQRSEALKLFRETTDILQKRSAMVGQTYSPLGEKEQRVARNLYADHVELAYSHYTKSQSGERAAFLDETFDVAQSAQVSTTAKAINQMAARFSTRTGTLGKAIRKHQDHLENWRYLDKQLHDILTKRLTSKRKRQIQQLRQDIAKLEQEIESMNREFAQSFPEYLELTNPKPISLSGVQKLLLPHEALLFHLTQKDRSYVWLIKANSAHIIRTALGSGRLAKFVQRIRATLDFSTGQIVKFDSPNAYSLYYELFGPLQKHLQGVEHLLFVPDGAFHSLPLAVLIDQQVAAKASDHRDYSNYSWFGKKYAISTLPSVSALTALRAITKASQATKPFVGFGNPILGTATENPTKPAIDAVFKDAMKIDIEAIRAMEPLPETADELTKMMTHLRASKEDLHLREDASEKMVKSLPLMDYRIIAFATHGLMSGDFRGLAEPALVLTPPDKQTSTDEGLLTTSEITKINLDADWVILSACNTAAADGTPGADGFSGLAKSFFYAGARTLLVSHWPVATEPTVLLTTGTIDRMVKDPTLTKAKALQQSIATLIAGQPQAEYAHPSFWAPFVLVGDGK